MKVLGTQTRSNGTMVRVQDGDGTPIIEAWTPADLSTVQSWNGDVPATYELKDGKRGPMLVDKTERRGGGSYSQSKEAFDRSAASRAAWQREEEDRKDRRTALMTAFEWITPEPKDIPVQKVVDAALTVASQMYDWLRYPDSSASSPDGADDAAGGAPITPPSGDTVMQPSPAAPTFAADPATCDHRTASGAWVRWVAVPNNVPMEVGGSTMPPGSLSKQVCPKCGMDKVSAMEGTTADLGSA